MAKLNGILKIEGTLQDMTFYKTQDGHLVKTKSGVSKTRIANDPAFACTRENGSEFGASATSGKLLRDALRSIVSSSSDNRVVSRLTQAMTQIKNFDTTSVRGSRSVDVGIATAEGKLILQNFNFNSKAILDAILHKPYSVDTATGIITMPNFVPMNDVVAPSGTTHISLTGAFAIVDFDLGTNNVSYSNISNLPLDGTSTNVTLTPTAVPTGTGTKLFLLQIDFFQQVNAVQYSLNNGSYNALAIIDVV